MGEGWLLCAEMVELIEDGYSNIICAQPFGCLPNHIAGKGVTNKIRENIQKQISLQSITILPQQRSTRKIESS